MSDVVVLDDQVQQRFEAYVGDVMAGFAAYELGPGRIVFTHTEVFDDYEGQGVGGALARGALDAVRRAGDLEVEPRCPFVRAWIDKHPDYQDLVAAS